MPSISGRLGNTDATLGLRLWLESCMSRCAQMQCRRGLPCQMGSRQRLGEMWAAVLVHVWTSR